VDAPPAAPHVWSTLGYRGIDQGEGEAIIECDAPVDYCFQGGSGPIVHGGLVTTLLTDGNHLARARCTQVLLPQR